MAEDERARHELFVRLEGAIGAEGAALLMERLPDVPWPELATKADLLGGLDSLEARLTTNLTNAFRAELHETVGRAITSQTRTIVFSVVAALLTNTGIVLAALSSS
jgi:hypothetical protein